MSLVATSWTSTQVAPTRSAPFAGLSETAPATPPSCNVAGGVAVVLGFSALVWLVLAGTKGMSFGAVGSVRPRARRSRWP
jgi:hypothetical protein